MNLAKNNLSICEYLEKLWDKEGDNQKVIDKMSKFGIFDSDLDSVVEIGTGSWCYVEKP